MHVLSLSVRQDLTAGASMIPQQQHGTILHYHHITLASTEQQVED